MVVIYAVIAVACFLTGPSSEPMSPKDLFEGLLGAGFWLALSIGCIWWGDELGEGLVGAKCGLVSSTSPGWAVKLMGWLLLFLPAAILVFYCLHEKAGH